jgi:hypothetical protein
MSWKMVVFNGKTIYQLWIYPIDFNKMTWDFRFNNVVNPIVGHPQYYHKGW